MILSNLISRNFDKNNDTNWFHHNYQKLIKVNIIKILQGSVRIQTVLGGLTIIPHFL